MLPLTPSYTRTHLSPPPSKKVKDDNATHNLHRERFPPSHHSSFAFQPPTYELCDIHDPRAPRKVSTGRWRFLSMSWIRVRRDRGRMSSRASAGLGGNLGIRVMYDVNDTKALNAEHERGPWASEHGRSPSPPAPKLGKGMHLAAPAENLEHPHFHRSQWNGGREEDVRMRGYEDAYGGREDVAVSPSLLLSPYRRHYTRHSPRFLLSRSFLAPSIHPSILARINMVPSTLVGISVLDVLRIAVLRPPSFGVDLHHPSTLYCPSTFSYTLPTFLSSPSSVQDDNATRNHDSHRKGMNVNVNVNEQSKPRTPTLRRSLKTLEDCFPFPIQVHGGGRLMGRGPEDTRKMIRGRKEDSRN
ncbi:hypothetical protein BDN70DRAFT_898611 [Pholiota conissans]|uniref:Uncharacterized protein n=1 Tax=Pholiota conissans TaxID=109636 RepID=A0A9P5YTJ0_9AGAR|nr:hypothetical protein BDN70DRAFT_898611 [Pholiota conissans]